ncbi:MAG TPA: protease complex subunit PrcB family protein [Planctomycetota bacterium]|nr:protease complex subunit PrcB family protein [Planctomycetota bacterium]
MRAFASIAVAVCVTLAAASCVEGGDAPKAPTGTAAAPGASTGTAAPSKPLPYSAIASGTAPEGTPADTIFIRDRKAYEAAGAKVGFSTSKQPPPDFTTEMAVVVFASEVKPTAGWAVEVVGLEAAGQDLVLTIRDRPPAKGKMVAQVESLPFLALRLPLPQGKLTVRRDAAK